MMEFKDWIIGTCAVVGAGLGIYNALAGRTKIKVCFGKTRKNESPAIIVVNESTFEVTILDVGMIDHTGVRLPLFYNIAAEQRPYPAVIPARANEEFAFDMHETLTHTYKKIRYCYANTATGKEYSNVPWWRRLAPPPAPRF